jgi:hypothetical protein
MATELTRGRSATAGTPGRGVLMAWCGGWIVAVRRLSLVRIRRREEARGTPRLNLQARSFSEVKLRSPENLLRSRHSILG